VQHILAFSSCAVIVRHWFEIDLDDASMEHGARIELRELVAQPRRGTESAAQIITVDRPLWRADLFDRLTDPPGSFGVAHFHPEFSGVEPSARFWDPDLTASPWDWLHDQFAQVGDTGGRKAWPLDPEDASELSRSADEIVALARQFSPDLCHSAAECFALTRDARASVQLMISYLKRPELLDVDWVRPWTAALFVPFTGGQLDRIGPVDVVRNNEGRVVTALQLLDPFPALDQRIRVPQHPR
jgi:hypothetical protein